MVRDRLKVKLQSEFSNKERVLISPYYLHGKL